MEGKKKIVVLDDDKLFTALLVASLEEEFEVLVGHDGRRGLELCLAGGVAAVITDIGMPGFDGLQMLMEFQKSPELASIPILVVTATHFARLNRDEVLRFPQVKKILLKTDDLSGISAQLKAVLAGSGQ